jgi:hypothetical protein
LQLGELTGSDGGSPILVDLQASWSRLTRLRRGPRGPSEPLDWSSGPIEALVEREAELVPGDRGRWSPRVRAGRDLDRRLRAAGLVTVADRLRAPDAPTVFAPPPPSADVNEGASDRAYRSQLGGRVIDAGALLAFVRGDGLPADVLAGLSEQQRSDLDRVIGEWSGACGDSWGIAERADEPPVTWSNERLQHSFSLAAPPLADGEDEIVLRADDYDGTGLEWYSVDLVASPGDEEALGAAVDRGGTAPNGPLIGRERRTALAAPLTFPGAPADRFWEFEDGSIVLNSGRATRTSLARQVTVEFAVAFSPDWYIAPLTMPAGSVSRVDWVVVRDTFGVATLVGTTATHAHDFRGRQFQPAGYGPRDGDHPLLVVLPSSLGAQRSHPREQISIQRDEMANLAWAIEQVVLGPSGRGVEVTVKTEDLVPLPPTIGQRGDLVWRLATAVPASWTPMVADVAVAEGGERRVLVKARLLDTLGDAPRSSRATLLEHVRHVNDEEVTGSGLQVTILDQVARWSDGRIFAWRSRERHAGQSDASSGLRYDVTDLLATAGDPPAS